MVNETSLTTVVIATQVFAFVMGYLLGRMR
jgi:hypothetical protein